MAQNFDIMKTDISAVIVGNQVLADEFLRLKNVMLIRYVHSWGGQLACNVSVLYDVADFQHEAQYEAPKLN